MKIKYELIDNTVEIPDDLFDDGIDDKIDENFVICESIMEHFQENFTFEIVEDNRKNNDRNK